MRVLDSCAEECAIAGTHLGVPRWGLKQTSGSCKTELTLGALPGCPYVACLEHRWWADSCHQRWPEPESWRYVAVCSSISREKENRGCHYRQCFAFPPSNVFALSITYLENGRLGGTFIIDHVCLSEAFHFHVGQESVSICCSLQLPAASGQQGHSAGLWPRVEGGWEAVGAPGDSLSLGEGRGVRLVA